MNRRFLTLLLVLAPLLAGCAAVRGSGSGTPQQPAPKQIQVSVSPSPANVRTGSSEQFTATVTGSTNSTVSWSVNNIPGGNASTGTINSDGNYSAPAAPSETTTYTLYATNQFGRGTATLTVTVQ